MRSSLRHVLRRTATDPLLSPERPGHYNNYKDCFNNSISFRNRCESHHSNHMRFAYHFRLSSYLFRFGRSILIKKKAGRLRIVGRDLSNGSAFRWNHFTSFTSNASSSKRSISKSNVCSPNLLSRANLASFDLIRRSLKKKSKKEKSKRKSTRKTRIQ